MTHEGHFYFVLALTISFMYARSSGERLGWCLVMIAVKMVKHCIHVARSGINFLYCARCAAWITRMLPSKLGRDFTLPFAGGNSVKFTYSPFKIISANLLCTGGSPWPTRYKPWPDCVLGAVESPYDPDEPNSCDSVSKVWPRLGSDGDDWMVQMFLDMSPNAGISPNSIPAIHIEIKKNRENNSEMKEEERKSWKERKTNNSCNW